VAIQPASAGASGTVGSGFTDPWLLAMVAQRAIAGGWICVGLPHPTETTDDIVGMGSTLLDLVLATGRGAILTRRSGLGGTELKTRHLRLDAGQVPTLAGLATQLDTVIVATTAGQTYFGKL
jgi:hypothetical protein